MSSHRIASCRSCNADIIWFKHPRTGKSMPVNAETVEVGDEELNLDHMVSHFATCKQADFWRQPREKQS